MIEAFWALIVGAVFAAGIYLILRGNLAKLILGLIILAHAANLLIFTSGGLEKGKPAMLEKPTQTLATENPEEGPAKKTGKQQEKTADPLPQALILTAIVISFGVTAYFLTLAQKAYQLNLDTETKATEAPTWPR